MYFPSTILIMYSSAALESHDSAPWCVYTPCPHRVSQDALGRVGLDTMDACLFVLESGTSSSRLFFSSAGVKTLALTCRPVNPRMGCITCSDDYILAFHSDLLFQPFATRWFWAECRNLVWRNAAILKTRRSVDEPDTLDCSVMRWPVFSFFLCSYSLLLYYISILWQENTRIHLNYSTTSKLLL